MYVTHVTRREGCVVRPKRAAAKQWPRELSERFPPPSTSGPEGLPRQLCNLEASNIEALAPGPSFVSSAHPCLALFSSNNRLDKGLPEPRPPPRQLRTWLRPASVLYGCTACASPPRCVARRQVHLQPGLQVQAIELCEWQ